MPQYSFICVGLDCETQFDTIQSMNAPFPPCPHCGRDTKRVITSAPSFSLKGSGWAKDNYSCTDQGAQTNSDKADRKGKITSFAGQKNKGRSGI